MYESYVSNFFLKRKKVYHKTAIFWFTKNMQELLKSETEGKYDFFVAKNDDSRVGRSPLIQEYVKSAVIASKLV